MKITRRGFIRTSSLTTLGFSIVSVGSLMSKSNTISDKPVILGVSLSGLNILKACIFEGIKGHYFLIDSPLKELQGPYLGIRRVYSNISYQNLRKNEISLSLQDLIPHLGISLNKVILINGSGGRFSTRVARKQFDEFTNSNLEFKWVTSLPFKFEGSKKRKLAEDFTTDIKYHKNLIILNNDDISQVECNVLQREAFKKSDEIFVKKLRSLV